MYVHVFMYMYLCVYFVCVHVCMYIHMCIVWRGHTLRLEEEGSGNSSTNELWKWNLITVKLEF